MQVSQGPPPRPRREFHELYMPLSQVFEKLKAKGLLKPLDQRPVPNPLPVKFDVSKRCAYHQGLGCDTDRCYKLHHAIQDLIENKVITLLTRPNITNNPLPNHNFGRGLRIDCLFLGEEEEKDPSNLIYDIPKCFMLTWEELMDISSTTGYDIWNEDNLEIATPIYGGRHFKPHLDNSTPIYGGRHFKSQDTEPRDP